MTSSLPRALVRRGRVGACAEISLSQLKPCLPGPGSTPGQHGQQFRGVAHAVRVPGASLGPYTSIPRVNSIVTPVAVSTARHLHASTPPRLHYKNFSSRSHCLQYPSLLPSFFFPSCHDPGSGVGAGRAPRRASIGHQGPAEEGKGTFLCILLTAPSAPRPGGSTSCIFLWINALDLSHVYLATYPAVRETTRAAMAAQRFVQGTNSMSSKR